MKLTDESSSSIHLVRAYSPGSVRIGERLFRRSPVFCLAISRVQFSAIQKSARRLFARPSNRRILNHLHQFGRRGRPVHALL